MNCPRFISLSAPRPQSGKDTLAKMIVETYGPNQVASLAFGDYLRDCVSHLFGPVNAVELRAILDTSQKDIPTEMCMGSNIVHADYREWMIQNGHNLLEYRSPRWHMQHFGNDYMKEHMGLHDFWIEVVERRVAWLMKTMPELKVVLITDTRSPNEFDWLKKQGAEFWMVKRHGFPKDKHDEVETRHAVETHADNWKYDHVVWNEYGFPHQMIHTFLDNTDIVI